MSVKVKSDAGTTNPTKHRLPIDALVPILARSRTLNRVVDPIAYECVTLAFVRHGSAVLLSEFGEKLVKIGNVVALSANTLCGIEPEGSITVTTICLNRDYIIGQVSWQHTGMLVDRWAAQDFVDELYPEPAQILRLGENRAGMLMPWLDELVALSLDGPPPARWYRTQAVLFAVLDVIIPHLKTTPVRRSSSQRKTTHPGPSNPRQFAPLRAEARHAVELLRSAPMERWTLPALAEAVHLSPSQLGRVFVDAHGKSPMAYLMSVRAEHLARLLRETDLPIEVAMRRVGWHSRGHAARMFRQAVGVTPTRYRELSRQKTAA